MSLQLLIVIIIGIVVSIVVVREIYRFFFVKRASGSCGGCQGCDFNRFPNASRWAGDVDFFPADVYNSSVRGFQGFPEESDLTEKIHTKT